MTTNSIQNTVLLALCLLLWPVTSVAQQLSTNDEGHNMSAVLGIGADSPQISLQADNVPIADALKEICKKARWGLVLDADEALLAQPVTVLLPQKKPAGKVLEIVLLKKGLQATLDDGVLRVARLPEPQMEKAQPGEVADAVAPQPVDTDAKEIVIDDVSQLKDLKKRLKNKLKTQRDRHWDGDDSGVERVEMGAPVVIEANETVSKAISIGDDVTVSGTVEREAVSVGGN
ncbi:MAG: hypothetical protein JXX14_14000, partial [Deltaproteobacteria bacterium]|nr:hypothetical protein [Deltaproteobacteria bacterium]